MNAPFFVGGSSTNASPVIEDSAATYTVVESFIFGDTSPTDNHGIDATINVVHPLYGAPRGTLSAVIVDDATGGMDTGTIQWTYNVVGSAIQDLAAGETRIDRFRIPVIDAQGNTTEFEINITVTGTNDAPVFTSSPVTYTTSEDGALATSGTLTFNDVDIIDTHSVSVAVVASGDTPGLLLDNDALKALLATSISSLATEASGSIDYSFAGNASAFQYLQQGQTLTLTYTLTINDGQSGMVSQNFVVDISGTNDLPVLNVGAQLINDTSGDDTFAALDGFFVSTDKDFNDTDTYTAVGAVSDVSLAGFDASVTTAYGKLYFNSAIGSYRYVPDDAAIEGLKGTTTDTFTITVTDSQGGFDTRSFAVTLNGVNDAAVIVGGNDTGNVVEAGVANSGGTNTATGNLNHTDRDAADADDAWTAATINSTYGTLTINAAGEWSYVLNNDNATVQALNNGSMPLTDTITVATADGTATVITISIAGANDAAVITGTSTGNVTEAGGVNNATNPAPTATGDLLSQDVDNPTDAFQPVAAGASSNAGFGTYGVTAAGVWTYTLNNGNPTVQALNATQSTSDTITVTTVDGTTQTVTITIQGTNDAPVVVAGGNTGSLTETGAIAGIVDRSVPGGFEPDASLITPSVQSELDGLLASPGDVPAVLASLTATFGNAATAIAVIWDYLDDIYVSAGFFQTNVNEAFVRLGVEYADRVNSGTLAPFTEVIAKFTADDGDVGTAPQRLQSLHDNLLGNLSSAAIGDRAFGSPLEGQLTALVASVDPDLLTRAYYAGNEGESDAAARLFDAQNGFDSSVGGQLAATDVDTGATQTWSGSTTSALGSFVIAANGAWTYTLDNAAAAYLSQGVTTTDTFTATVSDGLGGTATTVVTITITGTNDGPVAIADVKSGLEDATLTGSVATNDSDADTGAVLTYALNAPVAGLSLAANGGYTFDAGNTAYQYLAVGQTVDVVATYTVTDQFGAKNISTLTITLTGTNDAPVVVAGGAVTGAYSEGPGTGSMATISPVLTGSFDYTDIDATDTHTLNSDGAGPLSVGVSGFSYTLPGANAAQTAALLALQARFEASLTPAGSNGTVNWTFNPLEGELDFLRVAQTATLTFTITVNDGNSGTVSQNVVLTLSGANDVVVDVDANVNLSGTVIEPGAASALTDTITAGGTFDFRDADLTENVVVITRTGGTVATGHEGTLTQVRTGPDGTGLQTVAWTYTNTHGNVNYLGVGDSATETFRVRALDQVTGGWLDHFVTITINGTNDAPVLAVITSPMPVAEAAGDSSTQDISAIAGTLSVTDVDTGGAAADMLTASTTGVTVALNGNAFPLPPGAADLIAPGALVFGPSITANGLSQTIGWTYNPGAVNLDFLAAGEQLTLTYNVKVTDNSGQPTADSTPQTLVITITGTNDVPTITAATIEDTTAVEAGGVSNGVLGTPEVSGDASNGGANWNDIDQGEDALLAISKGSSGAAAQTALSFTEGMASDEAKIVGTYGDLFIKSNGQYRYVLDNTRAATQALDDAGSVQETFNYTVANNGGGLVNEAISTIAINVAGTNDAPVLSAIAPAAAILELTSATAQNLSTSGSLIVTDVDANDTLTPVVTGAAVVTSTTALSPALVTLLESAANLSIAPASQSSASGTAQTFTWSYAASGANLDYLAAGETITITYGVKAGDGTADSTTQNIVLTITGTNDQPVITAIDVTGGVTEDAGVTLTDAGSISFTDADATDLSTATVALQSTTTTATVSPGLAAALASALTISGAGVASAAHDGAVNWNFSLVNTLADYLAAGETVTATYRITVTDDSGTASASQFQDVTITITGAQDGPTLDGGGDVTESFDEAGLGSNVLSTTGSFGVTDLDLSNTLVITEGTTTLAWSNVGGTIPPGVVSALTAAGAFTVSDTNPLSNLATVSWSVNATADLNFLAFGETLTMTTPVTVSDGTASVVRNVVITITGTNDVPVAVADVVAPLAENASALNVNVIGNDSDVDTGSSFSLIGITALTNSNISGLGTLTGPELAALNAYFSANTGAGTISFNPGAGLGGTGGVFGSTASIFDRLDAGQTATITLTYTIQDNLGAPATSTVTYTINGAKEVFIGTPSSDNGINGSDFADSIDGLSGDDIINGNEGDDVIVGGDGADQINSGSDNDTVTGGAGNDVINGATGTDTAIYSGNWSDYAISSSSPSTFTISDNRGVGSDGTDSVEGVEFFTFANGTFTAAQIINDAPVAVGDTGTPIAEDGTFTISKAALLGNDTDADTPLGDILSINVVGGASTGSVTIVGSNVVFTPGANFNGTATFTYTANDLKGLTSTATVSVMVTAVNDAPVLSIATLDQSATEDIGLTYTLPPGTFTDVDNASLTLTATGLPSWLTFDANSGTFSGTPQNGQLGGTVTVRATDAAGLFAESTFIVTVTPVNDAPVAGTDSGTIIEDAVSPLVVAVLANDSDIDNTVGQLSVTAVAVVGGAAVGTATINGNNEVVFTPASNFSGAVVINYTLSDGALTSAGVINVTVTPVSDAPTLSVAAAAGNEDTAIVLNIASALTDATEVLSISISGVPVGATLSAGTDAGGGVWTLTPAQLAGLTITPPLNSDADFTLTVTATSTDGAAVPATTVGTIAVTVNAVSDAPSLTVAPASGNEDTAIALSIASALVDTSEALSLSISGVPTGAILSAGTDTGGGVWTLTPAQLAGLTITPPANSDDDFTLTVTASSTDGLAAPATTVGTIAVTVNPVSDTPTLSVIAASGAEDTAISLSITAAPTDASEVLSISISGVPTGAVLSAGTNAGGGVWTLTSAQLTGLTFTPPLNSDADYTLTVTATSIDGAAAGATTASVPLFVAVSPVNDASSGSVSITGTATEDQLLSASNTIVDADGPSVLSVAYQWKRDGVAITGATGENYLLGDSDVGKVITVTASYTDALGLVTNVTSAGTAPIANINDAPVLVSISGTAIAEFGGNSTNGGVVGTFTTTDVDPAPTQTYSITSQSVAGAFAIAGNALVVADYSKLDFEQTALATHTVVVQVSDGAGGTSSKTFTISVTDRSPEIVSGTAADDTFVGGTANDNLSGADGADTLIGGDGNDQLNGGAGTDAMTGGAGNDTYFVDSLSDVVNEAAGFGTQDTVVSSVNFRLDTTSTAQGIEHISLSGTSDATAVGSAVFNVLSGNSGNNYLAGLGGNDAISGGAGDDRIIGGDGKDTLTGGVGNDAFIFTFIADSGGTQPRRDVITDFSQVTLTNNDWIDLSATDANGAVAGNQAFTFIGTAAFSGAAGELRYFQDVANNMTIIEGNVRVDGASPGPEMSIELKGLFTLTAGANNTFDIIV